MPFENLIPWNRKKDLPAHRAGVSVDDPFALLQTEMNRMFNAFNHDLLPWKDRSVNTWMPAVNVAETDKEVVVTAELPGMDLKDIDVSLTENVLVVKGEKKLENEAKDKDFHRIERSYGSFFRTIALPAEVDEEKVDATFSKGVLTVKLAKTPAARKDVHKIDVKVS